MGTIVTNDENQPDRRDFTDRSQIEALEEVAPLPKDHSGFQGRIAGGGALLIVMIIGL